MRSLHILPIALLAACQPATEANDTDQSAGQEAGAPQILPTPNSIEAEADGGKEGGGAIGSPQERWLGRFAATTQLCRGGAWDIGQTRIVTDSGTSCNIDRIGRAAHQVTLRMACSGEGMNTREEWVLTPEGTERMKVRRKAAGDPVDVDLIRCS